MPGVQFAPSPPNEAARVRQRSVLGRQFCGLRQDLLSVYGYRRAGSAVSAATTDLLIVTIQGLRHASVNDAPNVPLVDAYAESRGSDHDVELVGSPLIDETTAIGLACLSVEQPDPLHPCSRSRLYKFRARSTFVT